MQGGGRIIQLSSYGGQVAFPGNSLYHATKFGIEGFCEAVAQEVKPFNIGITLVEPGGARTEFRYGSAKVARLLPVYDGNPAHAFLKMLDATNGLAPGDPARMAARIIESVEKEPAPMRMVLGSLALARSSPVAGLKTTRLRLGLPSTAKVEYSRVIDPPACCRCLTPSPCASTLRSCRSPRNSALVRPGLSTSSRACGLDPVRAVSARNAGTKARATSPQ
jgi:hypothetical protein